VKPGFAQAEAPLAPLQIFAAARQEPNAAERLKAYRRLGQQFRAELLERPAVSFYASRDLVRVPYPTRYAFWNAFSLPLPLVHILNRVLLIQFPSPQGLKTLLVSPSDPVANAQTPFFRRLARGFGPFQTLGRRLASPILGSVAASLEEFGISAEAVDYISYDHLHTQDLRPWLGSYQSPGFFPNARLLVMRSEWEATQRLLPLQADWYCPAGLNGIPQHQVILLEQDTWLGDSIALIQTPGHTLGNHSIVVRTSEGIMVTSENGVAPEAYAPLHSKIPGLRRYALDTGSEVILNGNTQENSLEQYTSMVLEKILAGPSARNPDFPNLVCSSELAAYWAFPGVQPTFAMGPLTLGTPQATAP